MERLEAHRSFFARLITATVGIPGGGGRLAEAFKRDDLKNVQSLRRGTPPDETCWCAGGGWWLSTAPAA